MALARACDWLEVPDGHPFGMQTLPYGSFSDAHHPAHTRVGVAIGDQVLNLTEAARRLLPGRADDFSAGTLDRFMAAGDGAWAQVGRPDGMAQPRPLPQRARGPARPRRPA